MINQPRISPFKFLDPYDEWDRDVFFGREDKERALYNFVRKNKVVLAYGPSGSGKTSLVKCGLARQFEFSEWSPRFINRSGDFNLSLLRELGPWDGSVGRPPEYEDIIPVMVQRLAEIRREDLRPIFLIFDQFEELLILGKDKEKEKFKEVMRLLLDQYSMLACNIILLMREEFFASLNPFEKDVPGIGDNRLWLEPIGRDEVRDIIKRSCEHFNITLTDPDGAEDATAYAIVDAVTVKKVISLPYLQIYLDRLWHAAMAKQWPEGYSGKEAYVPSNGVIQWCRNSRASRTSFLIF